MFDLHGSACVGPALAVDLMSDCFEVVRSDAVSYATEMVNFKTLTERPDVFEVGRFMRKHGAVSPSRLHDAVALRVCASEPQPMFPASVGVVLQRVLHRRETLAEGLQGSVASHLVPVTGAKALGDNRVTAVRVCAKFHTTNHTSPVCTTIGSAPGKGPHA